LWESWITYNVVKKYLVFVKFPFWKQNTDTVHNYKILIIVQSVQTKNKGTCSTSGLNLFEPNIVRVVDHLSVVKNINFLQSDTFERRRKIELTPKNLWQVFSQFKHYLGMAHISWSLLYYICACTCSHGQSFYSRWSKNIYGKSGWIQFWTCAM